jgi:SAM-dependent methyltransferase
MYQVSRWAEQIKANEIPLWKAGIYALLRGGWDNRARKKLDLAEIPPPVTRVVSERGYPLSFRRRWAVEGLDIRRATIMVHGTGSGWDVVSWARLRPKHIVAIDLFPFDSWPEIVDHCKNAYGTDVEFVVSPLEKDFGLAPASVDLVVSDAVYEHCKDMGAVLRETSRLLKKGGRVYANYGPLWYCASGDHFSGRENLESSYNHILLEPDYYHEYVNSFRGESENFQDGVRYIELDLFSRLCTREYISLYESAGFEIDDLWLEVSARAIEFRARHSQKFEAIYSAFQDKITRNDLYIKAHHLRMHKS